MKKILLTLGIAFLGLAGNSYAQVIMTQNFESPTVAPALPSGWSQGSTGTPGWFTSSNAGTNWGALTGLYNIPAHSQYVVVDDAANPPNLHDTLKTPVFSLTGVTGIFLKYDYFFYNAELVAAPNPLETCHILGSSDGGATWALIDSVSGNGFDETDTWATAVVDLSSLSGANCRVAFVYTDDGGNILGCALDNISVLVPPADDLAFTSLTPTPGAPNSYGLTNGSLTLTGTVANNGSATVTSFNVSYVLGSGAVVTNTISGANIAPFTTGSFTDQVTLPANTGTYPLTAWVTLTGDANLSNDSATTSLIAVSSMPTKRIMIEEGTGSWCGYCVRGIVYMDSIWSIYATTTSIVSVHDYNTYDPMAEENQYTKDYDTYISSRISGYPSIVLDRSVSDDPSGVFTDYANMINNFGFADITLTGNTTGGKVNVTTNVKPAINMNGDYRLAMVITEDSVHGTAGGYLQHNYYSNANQGGSAGPLSGQGINYQTEPFAIPNEYYKFVDRYTVPDFESSSNGVASSLPATMTAGTTYSYTFAPVTIAADWKSSNLRVVVMLIDNNPNNVTYGQVLNSVNSIWTPLAITNVNAGIDEVRLFPNPANQQAYVSFSLQQTSNVQVEVYDAVGRLVYNTPAQSMNAGDQQLTIPTGNFASGIYNVRIQTENGIVTQRLSVVK